MRVIRKVIDHKSRTDEFRIIPLGDVHLGAAACDEKRLVATVEHIQKNNYWWVGMGDYCDFINRKDPRFNMMSMAKWLWTKADTVAEQRKKFLEIVKPIAHLCLVAVSGNHETSILRHTERDVYAEIVAGIKDDAGLAEDELLGLGYYGWLQLVFRRKTEEMKRASATILNINLHHGHVGGKLAGAKALTMQRWLWTHSADLVIFGHSHNTSIQKEAVEAIDNHGNVTLETRKGCYAGTFLSTVGKGHSTYSEIKGYFPLPMDGVEIILRPGAKMKKDRIKLIT